MLSVAVLGACDREQPPPVAASEESAAGEWRLVGPILEIGDEPATRLDDVVDAALLPDGRIAVLNGGTSELLLYTSNGEFLEAAGGRGEGGGRFRRPVRLDLTHPDSLLVFDASLNRESRFDTALRFIWMNETPPSGDDPFPRDVWLAGRNLVIGPRDPALRDPVRRVLGALGEPAEPVRFRTIIVDPHWRIWLRQEPHDVRASSQWEVLDLGGARLATVRTPAGFEPFHILPDVIVGRVREGGGERIRAYTLAGAPPAAGPDVIAAARAAESPPPAATTRVPDRMEEILETAAGLQQRRYEASGSYRYTHDADSLDWSEPLPEQYFLHVLEAGPNGFTLLLFDRESELGCGLTVGAAGPLGWTPGRVLCG
jgi:hypothetical protein